jgi:hypothetical protein
MKIAFLLLIFSLVLGFVIPYYVQDTISGAGIELPNFFRANAPLRFNFSIPVFFRVAGAIFLLIAIVRFILVQRRD